MNDDDPKQLQADAEFSRAVALRFALVLCGLIAACSVLVALADSTVLARLAG